MDKGDAVIFAGPSLPDRAAAQALLPGRYEGPAQQGDLLRAAMDQPAAIVLIDGYFERVPAVHHKEILWALSEGIPVYGAASLGALRAAELSAFGMIGVGKVFEDFASGRLERDDEVALVHGPAASGYAALSEPLVNLRSTFGLALTSGVLSAAAHDGLIRLAEEMFYPDRGYGTVLAAGVETGILDPGFDTEAFGSWVRSHAIDLKASDAVACLDRVGSDLSDRGTMADRGGGFDFSHTDAFDRLFQEVSGRDDDASGSADPVLAELEALALRLDQLAHGPVPPSDLARGVMAFRERHGLSDPVSVQAWLSGAGIGIDALSRALEEEARISRARASVRTESGTHGAIRRLLR